MRLGLIRMQHKGQQLNENLLVGESVGRLVGQVRRIVGEMIARGLVK